MYRWLETNRFRKATAAHEPFGVLCCSSIDLDVLYKEEKKGEMPTVILDYGIPKM